MNWKFHSFIVLEPSNLGISDVIAFLPNLDIDYCKNWFETISIQLETEICT